MTAIPPLFENQKQSLEVEAKLTRIFDNSDPGTGKTRVRLEGFAKRRARRGKCALIIAPKSLLDVAWVEDCRKYTPWLKIVAAYASNREKAFDTPADIYVTNHDAVKWLAKQPAAFFAKFSDLIIDESGAFKHHTSQRSKALNKIKKYFPVRICQNGTPNPNSILDVWHQVFILDDGERLGRSYYAFRNVVCTPEQNGPKPNMLKWVDREGVEAVVADMLKDITIRHRLEDCQDIPANHVYTVPFIMPAKQRRIYEEMQRNAVVDIKSTKIKGINAAAVLTKALQIASGAVYAEDGTYTVVDESRYELITDLIEARKFTVCFFLWEHQRDLLIKHAKARGLTYTLLDGSVNKTKRKEAVQYFQGGFYRVIFAQPQSAAHGLTLTKGTTTIWASPTFNLEHWIQGNHRIVRAGQKEKTETISVIAKNSVEEYVYSRMTAKNGRLDGYLDFFQKAA